MRWKSTTTNIVVAVVALAVGGVATAGAAKLLTGKDIKDGSLELKDLSKKARAALAAKAGPRGATGAAGPAGAAGAAGAAGQNGANGSSATGLTMGSVKISSPITEIVPLGGNGGQNTGNNEFVAGPTPNKALTISEMYVVGIGFTAADSVQVTVQLNGSDTPLTCTVTALISSCTMPGTLNVPARALVNIKAVGTSVGGPRFVSWSWTFS
jgi:hypothetical protein